MDQVTRCARHVDPEVLSALWRHRAVGCRPDQVVAALDDEVWVADDDDEYVWHIEGGFSGPAAGGRLRLDDLILNARAHLPLAAEVDRPRRWTLWDTWMAAAENTEHTTYVGAYTGWSILSWPSPIVRPLGANSAEFAGRVAPIDELLGRYAATLEECVDHIDPLGDGHVETWMPAGLRRFVVWLMADLVFAHAGWLFPVDDPLPPLTYDMSRFTR